MSRILPLLLAAALGLGASPSVAAQQDAAPATDALQVRVDKAIVDYEATKKDRQKQAQRNRALLWLGELDSAAVTAYLEKELEQAGDTPFAAVVLQAIAKVPRPSLQDDVWKVLHRPSAPVPVRNAAATAIVASGDRGLERLLDMVRGGSDVAKDVVRDAAVQALVASKQDRAHRGLAPLLVTGTSADRLKMLRAMESVQGVPPVSLARIKLVGEGDLEVSATAWRQLAAEGHERSKALAIDVLERLPEDPKPVVAAELIVGLATVQDPELYPVILRLGSSPAEPVRRALRNAAPIAAKDPALVAFLATKGLEDSRPATRDAAMVLLQKAPKEAVQPLLLKVRAELQRPKRKSLDLAIGLHDLLAKDPTWRTDVQTLALSPDPEVRTVGLSLLLELGADTAIVQAQQSLGSKPWELRSVAYRYLTKFRDVASIPLLIARWDREDGRLAAELAQALFVHTGTRCWEKKEWEAWWQKHRSGFVLPNEGTVRGAVGSGGGKTVSYYDIPLVSSRVAFLIDRSGSMMAPIGTDKKFNRLEAAKRQLERVLEALPDTHFCNLIAYESGVQPLWDTLRKANDENRQEILDRVRKIALGGGTNIFDALETAFRDPEVDTIYLLTDGQPSAGRLVNTDDILDEVQRWNRQRQIVIHCIGLGIDSALLKRLAAMTGGSYKYVQ